MIAKGYKSVTKQDVLNRVSEPQILAHYFGIYEVPTVINSPLRKDTNASFGFCSPNGQDINYKDFGDPSEKGSIFTLLHKLWKIDYHEVYSRILREVTDNQVTTIKTCRVTSHSAHRSSCILDVKVRDWKLYDLEWWGQYGITRKWLDLAEVYPISHIIRTKEDSRMVFPADKYAYVYVERKEGKITKKIYQPLNTDGYKWCQDNDKSVLGLWTLLPKKGERVFICSSVKDALTLMCNCTLPAICMQGEGYDVSNTVINELKQRFTEVFVLLDNDPPGIKDAEKLCEQTGFTNLIIPPFDAGKDLADYRKAYGHDSFVQLVSNLLEKTEKHYESNRSFNPESSQVYTQHPG